MNYIFKEYILQIQFSKFDLNWASNGKAKEITTGRALRTVTKLGWMETANLLSNVIVETKLAPFNISSADINWKHMYRMRINARIKGVYLKKSVHMQTPESVAESASFMKTEM